MSGDSMEKTTLLPHQQRVVDEEGELRNRLGKLQAFIGSDAFDRINASERALMRSQAFYMSGYLNALACRIELRRLAA